MEMFEYPSHSLAHLTYTGKQDSKRPWRNVRRVTEEYILYFVIEGEIFLEEDGTPYHLTPGDFFLLEPGKLHFGTQYSRCVFYYVHFRHPEIKKRLCEPRDAESEEKRAHAAWRIAAEGGPFPEETVSIPKRYHIGEAADIAHFSNLFEQLLARQALRLEHFNALGAAALCEILISLARLRGRMLLHGKTRGEITAERLNAVLAYLRTNYKRPLTSRDIEKDLAYNFDYLNQLFSKHLHISVFRLLESIRMEEAIHILKTQSLSVKAIAREVGYSDEAYFSKVFKKRTGRTPSEYREGGAEADL